MVMAVPHGIEYLCEREGGYDREVLVRGLFELGEGCFAVRILALDQVLRDVIEVGKRGGDVLPFFGDERRVHRVTVEVYPVAEFS